MASLHSSHYASIMCNRKPVFGLLPEFDELESGSATGIDPNLEVKAVAGGGGARFDEGIREALLAELFQQANLGIEGDSVATVSTPVRTITTAPSGTSNTIGR